MPDRSKTRWIQRGFLAAAMAMLVLPGLAILWAPAEPFPLEQERRNAAGLPELDRLSSREGLEGFERFFGDRLGARAWMLRAHAEAYRLLFRRSAHHAVLMGREGWLYQNAKEMTAVARHIEPFDELGLKQWRRRIEKRREVAEASGGRYIVSFAPCKATIFPEYLPASHEPLGVPTRVDEIFAHLEAETDIEWIDVRPALRAAKGSDLIYSKTGLHWTDSGAYWGGYRPFLERLSEWGGEFAELAPHARTSFRSRQIVDPHESLGLRLYLADYYPAVVEKMRLKEAPESTRQTLGGPGMLRVIRTPDAPGPRVLVLRDSFGTAFLPLLSMHFKETWHFLPLRVPEAQILAYFEEVKPDVVIDFMYETVLYTPEEILFTNRAARERRLEQATRKPEKSE